MLPSCIRGLIWLFIALTYVKVAPRYWNSFPHSTLCTSLFYLVPSLLVISLMLMDLVSTSMLFLAVFTSLMIRSSTMLVPIICTHGSHCFNPIVLSKDDFRFWNSQPFPRSCLIVNIWSFLIGINTVINMCLNNCVPSSLNFISWRNLSIPYTRSMEEWWPKDLPGSERIVTFESRQI